LTCRSLRTQTTLTRSLAPFFLTDRGLSHMGLSNVPPTSPGRAFSVGLFGAHPFKPTGMCPLFSLPRSTIRAAAASRRVRCFLLLSGRVPLRLTRFLLPLAGRVFLCLAWLVLALTRSISLRGIIVVLVLRHRSRTCCSKHSGCHDESFHDGLLFQVPP
jgi:hypothetical protein